MPKLGGKFGRGAGAWSTALAAWDLWLRIPPRHRKRLLQQARAQGTRLAKQAVSSSRKRRRS